MATKRKAPKKTKGILKNTKAVRTTAPRKKIVQGNGNTPIPYHPYIGLSAGENHDLDFQNYGFKKIKVPSFVPILKLPRPKLPNKPTFVKPFMALMQNKIFLLRQYFLPEVEDLIRHNVDKNKRTKSELALLAEDADPKKPLMVSSCAQSCIRMVLYYTFLFEEENKGAGADGVVGEFGDHRKKDRESNVKERTRLWNILRLEISEQLPGDKQVREKRAEQVLQGALRLAREDDVGYNTEKTDNQTKKVGNKVTKPAKEIRKLREGMTKNRANTGNNVEVVARGEVVASSNQR